ncbi:hypothetical protein IRJ41_006925 [Triplophysa rosa]|uniref:HMG domain-containing protein n=1 Tax=Triplophysa rosa TaxID=992332 RepID=A0A9W8CB02_TRIRA|nr:hypothetical protein IRJ41_006925 [Triplophysa rosa]
MHHSIIPFSKKNLVPQCTSCCTLYHCSLCPALKPTTLRKIKLHWEGKRICRCHLPCRNEAHYHCPNCSKTLLRRYIMEAHMLICSSSNFLHPPSSLASQLPRTSPAAAPIPVMTPALSEVPPATSPAAAPIPVMTPALSEVPPAAAPIPVMTPALSEVPPATSPVLVPVFASTGSQSSKRQSMVKCPHCSVTVLKKNLIIYINRKHTDHSKDITMHSHLSSVCVDASNGLSAVQRNGHGFSVPVVEECHQYQLLAHRSGHTFSLCEHLRSLDYCNDTAFEEHLEPSVLDEMVKFKFIGEAKKAVSLKRQKLAQAAHVPFSVLVVLGEQIHHYNRLGRVMVKYNSSAGTWHCPCAKPRISCPHKNIAKWHLFQAKRSLFTTEKVCKSSDTMDPQYTDEHIYTSPTNLQSTLEYIYTVYNNKKIPANLPDTASKSKTFPSNYLPVETTCMNCDGEIALDKPLLISAKAKVVTMEGVIDNRSTYTRRCPGCNMIYRYQEWKDGLHNFDDHVLLSLELCLYLRHSLQNHVSVSRTIDTLESLRGVKYPNRDTILHGYCHFEALTDNDYSYSCVNCSYHPPVVIMDLHKKGVFSMSVSDLKEPSPDFRGEVDIEDFWKSVNLEMIARRTKNPFAVQPSYDRWAPWIGNKTRMDHTVLNTEYAKLKCSCILLVLSELCKACNIDCKGSRIDLISRLRAEMKNRQSYDKMFQKIWGASGGWSVILCPHGVVYSIKFNLRAESPRDFTDLLLSWKHIPNVCVYDFARGLATHGNLRVPADVPFHPYEGRLAEPTAGNISLAKQGKLRVSLPWLFEKTDNLNTKGHPITGSSEHYDILRRISLVPELRGWLNSQTAEQFFANLRKNNYFLNNMAPSTRLYDAQHSSSQEYIHKPEASAKDCGPQCEALTNCENVSTCRASWTLGNHPAQKELLSYVLDIERPGNELIVRTANAVLNRSDFWTLGLNRDMESSVRSWLKSENQILR